jgi:CRP-like cAMP-binding protein
MCKETTDILRSALMEFGIKSTFSQNLFIENSSIKEFSKNKIIFSENKSNTFEYILFEGVLHRYNVNDNGENVTTGFYIANIAVTPHSARTINGKSIFTLQALTQAKIAEIPVKVLNLLRFTNEEYRAFGQNVLEAEISNILSNDIAYRSLNAKDRLIMLRKMYPNIENLVPHNIIASYLGITNVSFSRLRSEFAKH